jgi:uncharacterized membrane protein YgaE (UPF0421/DUF939 family)
MNINNHATAEANAVLLVQVLLGTNTAVWGIVTNRLLLLLVGIVVLLLVTTVVAKRRLAVVKLQEGQRP